VSAAGRVLAHPLVVTAVGAVLAALILPPLTRGWQDRQKELELKRDLVTRIAETSTAAVRQAIANPSSRADARRQWLVDRSVSNAIIATYFPDLADCWFVYSDGITAFLELPGGGNAKKTEIDDKLEQTRSTCAWDEGLPPEEEGRLHELEGQVLPVASKSTVDPSRLGTLLLIGRDGIIRRIVEADARGYAHGIL
jgi:hypothetical protein